MLPGDGFTVLDRLVTAEQVVPQQKLGRSVGTRPARTRGGRTSLPSTATFRIAASIHLRVTPVGGSGSGSPFALPHLYPFPQQLVCPSSRHMMAVCVQTPSVPTDACVRVTDTVVTSVALQLLASGPAGFPFLSRLLCSRPLLSSQFHTPRARASVRCASARP